MGGCCRGWFLMAVDVAQRNIIPRGIGQDALRNDDVRPQSPSLRAELGVRDADGR